MRNFPMAVSNLLQIFMENRTLKDEEEATAFVEALEMLSKSEPDPSLILGLFDIFIDKARISPPMDRLLNYIWWTFDHNFVVKYLVDATPRLFYSGRTWALDCYIRALARPERLEALQTAYRNATPETQQQIRTLLTEIEKKPYWSSAEREQIENDIKFVLS
ncbi:MAG: hypothetical protein ABI947_29930 [Chloroflexota bacterium]